MSTCKSCGARIMWAKTVAGKSIPLDVKPVAGGNIELRLPPPAKRAYEVRAHVVTPSPDVHRHVSHFVTCPNSAEHRKAKP